MNSIEKVVNLARLINEGGTYICGECPDYLIDEPKNCRRGFTAPSDCPKVIKGAVAAIRLEEDIEHDVYVPMPPIWERKVRVRITSVERPKPRIVVDERDP